MCSSSNNAKIIKSDPWPSVPAQHWVHVLMHSSGIWGAAGQTSGWTLVRVWSGLNHQDVWNRSVRICTGREQQCSMPAERFQHFIHLRHWQMSWLILSLIKCNYFQVLFSSNPETLKSSWHSLTTLTLHSSEFCLLFLITVSKAQARLHCGEEDSDERLLLVPRKWTGLLGSLSSGGRFMAWKSKTTAHPVYGRQARDRMF